MPRLSSIQSLALTGANPILSLSLDLEFIGPVSLFEFFIFEPWTASSGNTVRTFGGADDQTTGDVLVVIEPTGNFSPQDTEGLQLIQGTDTNTISFVTEVISQNSNGASLRLAQANAYDYIGNEDGPGQFEDLNRSVPAGYSIQIDSQDTAESRAIAEAMYNALQNIGAQVIIESQLQSITYVGTIQNTGGFDFYGGDNRISIDLNNIVWGIDTGPPPDGFEGDRIEVIG